MLEELEEKNLGINNNDNYEINGWSLTIYLWYEANGRWSRKCSWGWIKKDP